MVTLKVINIQKQPWWKFWKTDQWSVTVEVDGKRRILSIYESPTNYLSKNCLIDFIRYKYLHNDQFWDIHQKPKKSQKLPSLTEFQKRLEETLSARAKLRELEISGFTKCVARKTCLDDVPKEERIQVLRESLSKQFDDWAKVEAPEDEQEALADLRNVAGLLFLALS